MKRALSIGATAVLAVLGAAYIAGASTPAGTSSPGGLKVTTVQTGLTLTTSYQGVIAKCPDSSWAAAGGGYYLDAPSPDADDISIRASQRDQDSNGVQGWLVSAKWDTSIDGQSRAVVAEVECIKLG